MASISKRESGAWQNTSYGIRATATNTITTLPTTIYGDGTNAKVSIKGNTVQNGTPTHENPIMPEGCGELEAGQYKIPISSANTTTPVYLGEVETMRKIKKLVLTGEETMPNNDGASYNSETSTDRFVRDIPLSVADNGTSEIILCTHLGFQAQSWTVRTKTGCCIYCSRNTMQLHLRFYNTTLGITQSDTNEQRTEKLKAYLANQYANGTPVTVWYVLATEETAVVNEPLMKIDGYADEVNNISIPTTDGASTLSVDTTVQPSEVDVNYHGWHMGTVHEHISGEWD